MRTICLAYCLVAQQQHRCFVYLSMKQQVKKGESLFFTYKKSYTNVTNKLKNTLLF